MSDLVVRSYNVGFGDAVLVSIPDRTRSGSERLRHVLFDVGNLLAGEGNDDGVLVDAVRDIVTITGGVVDLYVMTHEHLDHVQGLLAASRAGVALRARRAWLTGSAHPDYYANHPEARKKLAEYRLALDDVRRQLESDRDPWLDFMLRNNSILLPPGALGLKTSDYVDHLRAIAATTRTHYVDRTTINPRHPFTEATLRILAPEEDTSSYYGRRPANLLRTDAAADAGAAPAAAAAGAGRRGRRANAADPAAAFPTAPPGVDPSGFFDLVASRQRHRRELVLEIDKAANNTSLVVEIEWRGWRLLFGGDAEERSWETIRDLDLLRPVHLVKISHHGSVNGTVDEVLDIAMPPVAPDARPRHAILSTHDGDWDSVPDDDTIALYAGRCTLHDTRQIARGTCLEVRFPG
jgi:hypothetical protein